MRTETFNIHGMSIQLEFQPADHDLNLVLKDVKVTAPAIFTAWAKAQVPEILEMGKTGWRNASGIFEDKPI